MTMRKLMAVLLGLSFVLGSASMSFGAEKTKKTKATKAKKTKATAKK
jgi:hypothetical protein